MNEIEIDSDDGFFDGEVNDWTVKIDDDASCIDEGLDKRNKE